MNWKELKDLLSTCNNDADFIELQDMARDDSLKLGAISLSKFAQRISETDRELSFLMKSQSNNIIERYVQK